MSKKNGHTPKGTATKPRFDDTSRKAQRKRLLSALTEIGSVNTMYARDSLNIMMPAARIKELRDQGHTIKTERITITDRNGYQHKYVARYVLIRMAEGFLNGSQS